SFQRPEGADQLSDGMLYQNAKVGLWGKGHDYQYDNGVWKGHLEIYLDAPLWNSKEGTYGTTTLKDGTVYKAFTWKYIDERDSVEQYRWNGFRWKVGFWGSINKNWSHMTEEIVTQTFSHKPAAQGMIQSHGNLIINADNIENNYSIIEAGGNADIHANVLTNVGETAYKNTFMHCHANTDSYCYAYNADGSRNDHLDIANNKDRQTGSEVLDTVPGLVQAGGTLNLVVDQLNNKAAEGSITGDAHFEAKAAGGNPLEALSGLTGAGALFTPKVDLNGTEELAEGSTLPLPKPQSGGVGGTLPQQNFIYETRADFLDVGKFYGSAYFLNRIGYKPDREIFFLGDAYFEKQLIEKQMRDLVGQGLGKGSFIPGSDAIEQVKSLLDVGADYAKAHNLVFGEPLSEEQLASLEAPMVIYVRQQVKGMDVYAPVLYIPEKDRASFVSAGALIMGDDVNITSPNTSTSTIINSGRIAAKNQLNVHGGDILSQGGHFAADGDAVLLAENNIRLDAGRTTVDGVETVLNTHALSSGGNATVLAKKDMTASGVKITTKGDLAMVTEQGNLTIGAVKTEYHDAQSDASMHHQSEVNSGGSTTLSSGKDLHVLGSKVQATDNLFLQAKENVSIDATRNSANSHRGEQTSHVAVHNGSHLSSGKDTTVLSGKDIHVSASDIDAKGNVALGAQGDITIDTKSDEMEYHLQNKNLKVDMQASRAVGSSINAGGDISAIAGQDGKPHDLTITGSSVTADGKVGLKTSHDILINNAENSLQYEMSYHKEGGAFSSSKSQHNKIDATQVSGSLISGGKGVAIDSGNNTEIVASILTAGKTGETSGAKTPEDQAKADITIHSGGNILIKGAQEKYDQQAQSSESGFLSSKSSDTSQSHTTTVSSILGATGNIITQSDKETTITASHMIANEDINVAGQSVTIDGMTDHHESHSETHETGFGVGSGKGFVSIFGSESKTENEESFEHQGSSLNGKNITITAKKEDVNVVGSDFTAEENINVSAVHNVNVLPGHNSHSTNSKEERTGFGIQFEKNRSGVSVGIGVAGAKDKGDQWEKFNTASNFKAGKDVQINAGNDVNLQATNVLANRDVNINAGNNITLSESYDTSNVQEKHEKFFAGVTGSVNVGVLGTVQDIRDAGKRFGHGDTKHKIGNGLLGGLKGYDLYNKGKGLYNGIKGGASKSDLRNMADVSASITAGFKAEKAEASSQVSTAVTTTIEGGRSINMHANNGSIHGVGADLIAGTNPLSNDEQSGNITLDAKQNILFESAQNTQSTQNHSQNISANVGYSYGSGGQGWMGNASFGKGKGSSEQVHHKNSHIIGTGTVHTNSGGNTTFAGAVVSGNRVEMGVGGDFIITSLSDTGQTSSKQNSVSVGFNGGKKDDAASTNIAFNKDKTSSDYHSVVEQSGIKAGEGGFDITVAGATTMTGGIIGSTAPANKNKLTTGTIKMSDITNSADAQANSDGISISAGGPMYQGKYGVGKNIAKNVLDHAKAKDSEEGYTKSAISNSTIVLTNEAGQKALTGQDVEQAIASLNRDTASAHKGVQQL
ncbi:hemagglutinin repeat-containing protein, partial [Bartonella sp. AU16XJBT]|uniref:hemagglutinin repeat-containing protein n=1 Tax=Bartonella sp. AU16XJBT TaxID=3019088 RepID=UPI00235F2F24